MDAKSPARKRYGVHAVLMFLRNEVDAGRGFPSHGRIFEYMQKEYGWKAKSSVQDALLRLAANGKLRVISRTPSGRGWRWFFALNETVH